MRATLAISSATTALATIALLTSCGGGGDGSRGAAGPPTTDSSTVSTTPSATPRPSPPLSRPPEPSSSVPTGTAPLSETPSSTSTGGSSGSVHSYQDLTITLPVAEDAIPNAPQGLTAYVRGILAKQWDRYRHAAGCEKAPQVQVMGTRSDGFAYVYRAADPSVASCPEAIEDSGGYRAVLKDVGGTWRQIMAFQDVPTCATFEKWGVPSAILVPDDKCAKGNAVVTYVHG